MFLGLQRSVEAALQMVHERRLAEGQTAVHGAVKPANGVATESAQFEALTPVAVEIGPCPQIDETGGIVGTKMRAGA